LRFNVVVAAQCAIHHRRFLITTRPFPIPHCGCCSSRCCCIRFFFCCVCCPCCYRGDGDDRTCNDVVVVVVVVCPTPAAGSSQPVALIINVVDVFRILQSSPPESAHPDHPCFDRQYAQLVSDDIILRRERDRGREVTEVKEK
jgi:hypothetical protein